MRVFNASQTPPSRLSFPQVAHGGLMLTFILGLLPAVATGGSGMSTNPEKHLRLYRGTDREGPAEGKDRQANHPTSAPASREVPVRSVHPALTFERNVGQAQARIDFVGRSGHFTLYTTKGGPVVTAGNADATWELDLQGARKDPVALGLDPVRTRSHYFKGPNPDRSLTDIPHYARVAYEDVYPGIDLIYHTSSKRIEFDFLVAPGANTQSIRIGWGTASTAAVTPNGDLWIKGPAGELTLRRPVAYQDTLLAHQPVDAEFVLDPSTHSAGFRLGPYDRRNPVVIDPILDYSTYLGGNDRDETNDLHVGPDGAVYLTGFTDSTDFPGANNTPNGLHDVFVTKILPDGSAPVYSTYIGGEGHDIGYGITADALGNVWIVGVTYSADFPRVNPIWNTPTPGAFIAKLDPTGAALTYSDTNNQLSLRGITLDASGNAYMTGAGGCGFTTTPGVFQPYCNGGPADGVAVKLSSDATTILYATFLGGSGGTVSEMGMRIAVDAGLNAHIVGRTDSTDFPTTANAFQATSGGGVDAFIAKLDPSAASLLYGTYMGGAGSDESYGLALGTGGFVYAAGITNSRNLPTRTPYQAALAGGIDFFYCKVDPSAGMGADSLVFSSYLGGSADEKINFDQGGIGQFHPDVAGKVAAVDAGGSLHLIGSSKSPDYPVVLPLSGSASLLGPQDIVATKITPSGSALVFSTFLGSTGGEEGRALALGGSGALVLSGYTQLDVLPDFPVTPDAFQPSPGLGRDSYLSVIAPDLPCSSTVLTISELEDEVSALASQGVPQRVIDALLALLDTAQQQLDAGEHADARTSLAAFVRRIVQGSNRLVIPLDPANHLVCGTANVIGTIPLP
ncbi:MAG: SBBP repeat-containing protein [Nitrospirae bacterium]|nr:SBBP repeat-containing protein [Nitrospirota bacterium]